MKEETRNKVITAVFFIFCAAIGFFAAISEDSFLSEKHIPEWECIEWKPIDCLDCRTYKTDELNITCFDNICYDEHLCGNETCVTPIKCVKEVYVRRR